MTQVVDCLSKKHKALSSNPVPSKKKKKKKDLVKGERAVK
jgi:hypothetical protein